MVKKPSTSGLRAAGSVGIVIPAYNEQEVISVVLREVKKVFGGSVHKIIVVNDGSTDATSKEVTKHKGVILLEHIINMGAGAATRTGIAYAKKAGCDYVVTMDSDGQHHIKDVIRLANKIAQGKSDFIIGSRLINTSGMPWYRIFGNKILNAFTLLLFGVVVSDSQSGLKALGTKSLKSLEYRSNNYAFCSEMIWQAKRAGLKITEIPVSAIYTDYSLAKGQSNLDVIHIFKQLLKRRFLDFING